MLTTAIAEAAETAAETTESANIGVGAILSIVVSVYFLIMGLASIVTGKVYGLGSSMSKYTDESIAKFARPYGGTLLLAGLGFTLADISLYFKVGGLPLVIAGAVCAVIALIIMTVLQVKVLKKK